MSKAEILEELPNLKPEERREVLERIWQIDEKAILSGEASPTEEEKTLLDRELADYESNPNAGAAGTPLSRGCSTNPASEMANRSSTAG